MKMEDRFPPEALVARSLGVKRTKRGQMGEMMWVYYEIQGIYPAAFDRKIIGYERLSDEDMKHMSTTLKIEPVTKGAREALDVARALGGQTKVRWAQWYLSNPSVVG